MIYVTVCKGNRQSDLEKLCDQADIPNNLRSAIYNLNLLGVKVTTDDSAGNKSNKRIPRTIPEGICLCIKKKFFKRQFIKNMSVKTPPRKI